MNPMTSIWEALREGGPQTKIVAGIIAALFLAIVGVTGFLSQQKHYEILAGDLNATQMARVTRALADAGVAFEHSQPPGPFTVFVEEGSRHLAFAAMASAGALDQAPKGIPGVAEGASSVFMSADERSQMVRKREWEDTEGMLESLDFIKQATVRTSAESSSPFGTPAGVRASVALVVAPGIVLDTMQAQTVAQMIQFGLNVAPERLVVTDQNGQSIFSGASGDDTSMDARSWMEHRAKFDGELEDHINGFLSMNFGPDKARVKINSEWDFDHSVTRSETHPGSKAVLSESKRTTKTPAGSPTVGGNAGTSSNLSDPVIQAAIGGTAGSQGIVIPPPMAETEDTRKAFADATVLTETVRTVPILKHLSISLIFDETLADKQIELEQAVQAAAGYRSERGDVFSSMPTTFYKPEVDAEEAIDPEAAEESAPSEPNPMLETLLERGVEIVSAMAFIFLLLKSLKARKEPESEIVPVATKNDEPKIDPEALAKAQLDELLANDPERVGQILSDWVREENASLSRSA